MRKNLTTCPTCGGKLKISQYRCDMCDIDINGEFEGCNFCNLSDEDRYFALVFLQTGGNIKDVERVMGISYPTVKAKLHLLIQNLGLANGDGRHHVHHVDRAAIRQTKADVKASMKNLKTELKGMKIKLKSGRKGHGHFHMTQCRPCHPKQDVEDAPSAAIDNEAAASIIGDLKDGKINVDAALSRLMGNPAETGEDVNGEKVKRDNPGDSEKS